MTPQTSPEYYPIELLHWAAMPDTNLYMIEDILSFHPEYINHTNRDGDNSLMIAARVGNIEIVKFFLEKTNINFEQCSNQGDFFMIAIHYSHKKLAELIFYKFIDKIGIQRVNSKKENFFHLAALKGYDFIFEESSFIKHIKKLDIKNQHCLFHFVEGYPYHLNYWCFQLIQENFNLDLLFVKNQDNETILDYVHKLIKKSKTLTNNPIVFNSTVYEPIVNILNILKSKLEASI